MNESKSTRLARLVEAAERRGDAIASTWRAERTSANYYGVGSHIDIWHHKTLMLRLERWTTGWYAHPVSEGRGSVSDKQGVGKILVGCRALNARSYRELYGEV